MRVLGYSEQGAYKRIQAARAARTHPALLQRLADGELHLAAIVVLAPHLRVENLHARLEAARGKNIRELEAMAAGWAPRPEAREFLRALPSRATLDERTDVAAAELKPPSSASDPALRSPAAAPGASHPPPSTGLGTRPMQGAPGPREQIEPLSAERFLFRFTAGAGLRADFMRARDLLPIQPSAGPMEAVFRAALGALLDRLDPQRRHARRQRAKRRETRRREGPADGRDPSRRIPRPLRDAVWTRDGGRCTFVGPDSQRCTATRYLEIDHVRPYALGGRSDDHANLRLTCRAHNQLLARRAFGEATCRGKGAPKRLTG